VRKSFGRALKPKEDTNPFRSYYKSPFRTGEWRQGVSCGVLGMKEVLRFGGEGGCLGNWVNY